MVDTKCDEKIISVFAVLTDTFVNSIICAMQMMDYASAVALVVFSMFALCAR